MDLLTDILRQAGLQRRVLNLQHLPSDQAVRFPCDKSIGLHIAVEGPVHIHARSLVVPLVLETGDIALMARGCHHFLSATPAPDLAQARTIEHTQRDTPNDGESGAIAISGAYQLWNAPLHPFLAKRAEWFVVRGAQLAPQAPISLAVALLKAEARGHQLGAETIVNGLLDVLLAHLLRAMIEREAADGPSWSRAVADAHVENAVTLMHGNFAHPWTLNELAARVGLSRTRLAERFRDAMGDTPLAYLRTVRMQAATRMLSESDRKLEAVARDVGYQDAFGFSKIFKRVVGVTPKEFRRRDTAERSDPWRFAAQ